ncbi:MAG: RNA-binding S4 domain-containing protein [Burkholderiaceae bacterium]
MTTATGQPAVRIDKWLWAARFFKTRGLAQVAIENGRVLVGNERVKRARVLQPGEQLRIRQGDVERTVVVLALSEHRGPAPVARLLYEAPNPCKARNRPAEPADQPMDPASAIAAGRPTKRDRRALLNLHEGDRDQAE